MWHRPLGFRAKPGPLVSSLLAYWNYNRSNWKRFFDCHGDAHYRKFNPPAAANHHGSQPEGR
jgi:hypothetical protein